MNIDQYCKLMNQITNNMRNVNTCLTITGPLGIATDVLRVEIALANQVTEMFNDSDRMTNIYQTEDDSLDADSFIWLMEILYGGANHE